ncbi:MAG: alginate export family protein [Phycisphaerae bacterium]|nr:alginate export family protein [Phycisphaerae bacterium]NUQ45328.1 alginate export family protein [Phycisphaerae bacterium]
MIGNVRAVSAWTLMILSMVCSDATAQSSEPRNASTAPSQTVATAGAPHSSATQKAGATSQPAAPLTLDYYVRPPGYGTVGETEPPRYARTLSQTGIPSLAELNWLDFGIDFRNRFEYRDDDYRRTRLTLDTPFLLRSRMYVGIHDIFDPFRFVLEFKDARWENSKFPDTDREVDENDIIQAYGELYFKDALGPQRPLRLQAGRFAFDYLDRRLISRNPWRNTVNNFDGFRAILGQQSNDWQLDLLAMQPVERRLRQPDRTDEEEWFYAAIGQWRRWSKIITLQPYYLVRDQDRKDPTRADREIHTLGLRGYGYVGDTGLDYDFNIALQVGDDGPREQRAMAAAGELGYTFKHAWKPRLSAFCGYASGDRDPNDRTTERFDRNFGFARPWSSNDYFVWENVIAPKLRLEMQPHKQLTFETGYHAYWLASDSDSWSSAARRDRLGRSCDFIGHELDARLRWKVDPRVEVILGYAHFMPGGFTKNTGDADDSDFFYVETSLQLFE